MEQLSNPFTLNKRAILKDLDSIEEQLLRAGTIEYHCSKCNFKHRRGQIYHEHLQFAKKVVKFLPVHLPSYKETFNIRIVGLKKYHSKNRMRHMPEYQNLTLQCEDLSGRSPISVIVEETDGNAHQIGIISPKLKKNIRIRQALQENYRIKCYFRHFHPKRIRVYKRESARYFRYQRRKKYQEFWDVEHGTATVEIINLDQFMQIYQGLVELAQLGNTEVFDAFIRLGPEIIPFLEQSAKQDPNLTPLLEQLYESFKIRIKSNFSIIQ